MDFPILYDPLNLLELAVIPIITGIDEHGVAHGVTLETFEEAFLRAEFAPPTPTLEPLQPTSPDVAALQPAADADAGAWAEYGAALYLWSDIDRIDDAVAAFEQAASLADDDGRWHFRLGVCLRRRYESVHRRPDDFQNAVDAWSRALERDPNVYIWRRRIQQYGPRLDKPYPFYDWVRTARDEITARGDAPIAFEVEPVGAEFAKPLDMLAERSAAENPDPHGKIHRDEKGLIHIETVAVPGRMTPGGSARVHIVLRPNEKLKAHWNNEVDDVIIWFDPEPGWETEQRLYRISNPQQPVSNEIRRLDFEVQFSQIAPATAVLRGFALYYICEDVDGTCQYRRQDFSISW